MRGGNSHADQAGAEARFGLLLLQGIATAFALPAYYDILNKNTR